MDNMYVEASVKRRNGIKQILTIAGIVIASVVVYILANRFLGLIGIFVALAGIFGFYQAWLRLNVEYEYVFCDGQIDFDVIYNSSKRKNLLKIDVENADVIAPCDHDEITRANHIDSVKNYTSGESEVKPYAIIIKKDGKHLKILFEPTEEMLNKIRMKAPDRKSVV